MKKIGIFGSTGSIGTQALDIIRENPDKYKIVFLAAHSNSKKLISQSKEFKPLFTSIYKTPQQFVSRLGTLNYYSQISKPVIL